MGLEGISGDNHIRDAQNVSSSEPAFPFTISETGTRVGGSGPTDWARNHLADLLDNAPREKAMHIQICLGGKDD